MQRGDAILLQLKDMLFKTCLYVKFRRLTQFYIAYYVTKADKFLRDLFSVYKNKSHNLIPHIYKHLH
jgi:hypothetical protein